jgi:hypothetical protein
MKRCPYCHVDSFGISELLTLDYFNSDECEECKKPVRNDGFRQLLLIPAVLVVVFVSFVIFSIVPGVLEPFALLLGFVLVAFTMILLAKPVKAEYEEHYLQFDADPENDRVVLVSGWNEDELRQILDDFSAENVAGFPPYTIELHKHLEGYFRLTFPEDIHPSLFASLVNYLVYPIELDAGDRQLVVVGNTTLNSTFERIPKEFFGQKAVLYVPENDDDHDVVWLQTENGVNFANSLDGNNWSPVDDARMPVEVKKLAPQM